MRVSKKFLDSNSYSFGFWEFLPKSYTKTLFYFPPGPNSGKNVQLFNEKFFPDTRIIGVDYPGRGLMKWLKDQNSIDQIANYCNSLIEAIGEQNVILFGTSFGTAIITRMMQNHETKSKGIILLAGGEYIPRAYQPFVNRIVNAEIDSPKELKRIEDAVEFFYKTSLKSGVVDFDIKAIQAQLHAINSYKIQKVPILTPTFILNARYELIVKAESIKKLKKAYPNSLMVHINHGHPLNVGKKDHYLYTEVQPLAKLFITAILREKFLGD